MSKIQPYSKEFGSEERIHLNKEIERIIKNGRRYSNKQFDLIWIERELSAGSISQKSRRFAIRFQSRFAEAVPKGTAPFLRKIRIGAVVRNRIKRLAKEIFRHEKSNMSLNIDVLLIVKPVANFQRANYFILKEQFLSLCKKAGVLKDF